MDNFDWPITKKNLNFENVLFIGIDVDIFYTKIYFSKRITWIYTYLHGK
jgi:hypothetical protein